MTDHVVERYALGMFWATWRQSLTPELTSPLARDRAVRADAAMTRLVAGYEVLPGLRADYAQEYTAMLARARSATAAARADASITVGPEAARADTPIFVGIPAVAGELEAHLLAGERASKPAAVHDETLMREIVRLEARCRGDYETRVRAMIPVRGAGGSEQQRRQELNVGTLQRYLRSHPRGSAHILVSKVNEIPGGRSKRTVLVELAQAGPLPAELVLRLDTGRGVGTSVIDEYPLLARVAQRQLPVPDPLWLEASGEHFGQPFIVFRRSPGASAGHLIDGAFRKEPRTGNALARSLAQVHAGGVALIDNPAERGPAVTHTRALLTHYLDYWRSKKPLPSLIIEAAFMYLFHRLEQGLGDATIVHADTGFHNLLLDDAGNGCLLDWEFAHFGDPAEDLASCRPAVEQCMPWADFMAEYQRHGGQPASDFRLNFFEIWRPLRNAVVCGTTLDSMMKGEADDIDPVTISLSTFQRLQADLARTLDALMSRQDG